MTELHSRSRGCHVASPIPCHLQLAIARDLPPARLFDATSPIMANQNVEASTYAPPAAAGHTPYVVPPRLPSPTRPSTNTQNVEESTDGHPAVAGHTPHVVPPRLPSPTRPIVVPARWPSGAPDLQAAPPELNAPAVAESEEPPPPPPPYLASEQPQQPPPPPPKPDLPVGTESDADSCSSDSSAGNRGPQLVHKKGNHPPVAASAPAAAGSSSSRTIHQPFRDRMDKGTFAVYQGNWSGRRKEQWLREHIYTDIVLECPASIVCAQEVDKDFVDVMRNPASGFSRARGKWVPKGGAAAVAAHQEALRASTPWHVACGDEGASSAGTCVIAARASVATEVQLLEWRKIPDGQYKNKNKQWRPAESRILVARVVWKKPMHGEAATVVATVHMHRLTAKKAKGFGKAHHDFWVHLTHLLKAYNPAVLTGDFNMSLCQVVPVLRQCKIPANLLSWFAWVKTEADRLPPVPEAEEEEEADGAPASAPAAAGEIEGEVMMDSCGIITLRRQLRQRCCLDVEDLQGSEKLPRFGAGQGYPLSSYVGGEEAARESLRKLPLLTKASGVPEHDPLADTKSKLLNPLMWDSSETLFKSGGHMPLIGYFGNVSGRSEAALSRREANSAKRGWGPTPGGKRSALMQAQGKGPAPSVLARQASAAAEGQDGGYPSSSPWQANAWSGGGWASSSSGTWHASP